VQQETIRNACTAAPSIRTVTRAQYPKRLYFLQRARTSDDSRTQRQERQLLVQQDLGISIHALSNEEEASLVAEEFLIRFQQTTGEEAVSGFASRKPPP
jgi:hypothetical protein